MGYFDEESESLLPVLKVQLRKGRVRAATIARQQGGGRKRASTVSGPAAGSSRPDANSGVKAPAVTKRVAIASIRIDATQMREKLNLTVVHDYSECLDDLPPAVVFFDGAEYWLGDGFHRYHATTRAGRTEVYCEVRNGTRDDAVWFACSANRAHGLRRTNADKHKAVAAALKLHPDYSDGMIAEHVGVSVQMVANMRPNSQNLGVARLGKDGKSRRQPQRKPNVKTNAAASPDAEKRTEVAGESDDRGGAADVLQPAELTLLDHAVRAIDALLEAPASLTQASIETVSAFMDRLRRLAGHCMPRLKPAKAPAQPAADQRGEAGADDAGAEHEDDGAGHEVPEDEADSDRSEADGSDAGY